ncbi:PTS system beta-glucoside-specific transporter subunit IIABC [Clostridioides difficile]|uniref:PTS system beta-glucoside-specific transporter subunit IIABC n=1 Tax=Clostridioides difficile TaxID=1496 RepID=A0AB74Q9E8_CLODI|nr:beta-glucoside-specific PTS transporter subunit IIABC [Clostridioides difficile]EGT4246341.1 PTS beta-glucoside transporter subunit EIIBCA [Clostridioides difficile]EGT4918972.1 PTS beta-glucoside transporter subunit EIIBCA [Clostridioides difficile]MBF9998655.1 PTS glucose transporter subunit IIA [Clostridioides difficile]MBY1311935.1 beta-glucoside-specific PTS transporter subunit IIABC [Clostridioides difficile]MBY1456231.1 beta-glucoside-specific PTS transporter subunit IIABC [Clostridi
MKYKDLNENIIKLIGGKENIKSVAHCVTRLRFTLNDRSIAQTEEIKKLKGVIDVVSNDVAYQIIIGTHVVDVYNEFMSMIGLSSSESSIKSERKKEIRGIKGIFNSIFVVVSETMTSVIEVLLAAGILASMLALLNMSGILQSDSPTYQILDTLRSATFHFLPVLIAIASAKRLNVNPYIAVVLAVTLLSSSIDGVEGLSLFGINLQATTYANSFIPILLGVWAMGIIIEGLKKILPKALHYFLVPVLSLIITLSVTLTVFGPIGMWIGDGLNYACMFLIDTLGNWSVVALYAALQPLLIVFGAANFTMPISLNSVTTLGYDPIFMGAATISDIAVCGAMFGYFLKTRNKEQKQLFGTVSFSALMGVTEPSVFGVFMKYRRPFVAVMIGGGIGGLIAGLAQVKTYGMVWGLAALPTYLVGGEVSNFTFMIISVVVSFVAATAASYLLGIPSDKKEEVKGDNEKELELIINENNSRTISIGNVAKGQVIALGEVNDKAFSSGALGKGVGVIPSESKSTVISPVDGTITIVFPTKHAYGIVTDEGLEILIHIGIDTVNLDGKFFESLVTQNQRVKKGDALAVFESDKIIEEGFDSTIITVVTNTSDYLDVISSNDESEELLTVIV